MLKKIKSMPLALSSLSLGIGGVCNAIGIIAKMKSVAYIGSVIASILVIIVIIKIILDVEIFKGELRHFVSSSVMPTIDMSIMVISSNIADFMPALAKVIWSVSIIVHFILLAAFIYFRFKENDFYKMLPTWFVPPIGIVVACVTSSLMNSSSISHFIFYFGLVFYIFMLPPMLYKMLFIYNIEDHVAPAFAVMGAPGNLLLAGYFTAFENLNPVIIHALLGIALFTTFLVYISLFRSFRLKFTPLFAAYTFPLSIGSTAVIKYFIYRQSSGMSHISLWQNIAIFETAIASIIIFYIFINMMIYIYKHILIKQSA